MYLIIIFGFVSVLEILWQKTATEVENSLFFHSKRWHDYHSNSRIDALSLLLCFQKIYTLCDLLLYFCETVQWKGSGKKNKHFQKSYPSWKG